MPRPPKTRPLHELMGEDGASYIGAQHDPLAAAPPPPEEEPRPLLDERVDVTTLEGAVHVVNATLNAYSNRKVSDRQVQTLMEIVKTATGLLATKHRHEKQQSPAEMPPVEEQVRMLATSGPFGMFAQATRTVRAGSPPLIADPMRVPLLPGED